MADKSFTYNILNSLIKKKYSVEENPSKELGDVKSILVVRQHNQLGDMLAGVSLLRALKEKYPKSHLTLISSVVNHYGVVKNKFIDELVIFDKTKLYNPEYLTALFKKLKKEFDVVIVPVTVSISFTSNFLARLSNSKIRIGPNSLDGKPNSSAYFFDRRVDIDWRRYPDSNVSEHILEIVKPFGIDTKDLSSEIYFDESDLKDAVQFFDKIKTDSDSLLIGVHVGAGKPANRWALKNYVQLVQKLNKKYNCTFYLTGTDTDKEEIDYVAANTNIKIHRFTNKTISQVAALISISKLFITNDTGIMHVAGTTSTPQISLFGPTNPFNWAPIGKDKIFLRKSDLIDDIEVENVFDTCIVLLGNKK